MKKQTFPKMTNALNVIFYFSVQTEKFVSLSSSRLRSVKDARRESLLAVAGYWKAASGAAAPGQPSAVAAGSAASLAWGTEAAGAALFGDQGSDSGSARTPEAEGAAVAGGAAGAAASGEASAAVEPVAVWVSSGPETRALREGLDVRKSAPHRFLHPPEGSAEATDDSASGSRSGDAGTVAPAAERSRSAAAASV